MQLIIDYIFLNEFFFSKVLPEAINKTGLFYDSNPSNSLKLHAMFNVYLPVGLFSRLIVRLCRWSWSMYLELKKKNMVKFFSKKYFLFFFLKD